MDFTRILLGVVSAMLIVTSVVMCNIDKDLSSSKKETAELKQQLISQDSAATVTLANALDSLNVEHNKEISFLNEQLKECEIRKNKIIYQTTGVAERDEYICDEEINKLSKEIDDLTLELNLTANELAMVDFELDSTRTELNKAYADLTKHRVANYESPLQMVKMFSEASEDSTYLEFQIKEPLFIKIQKTKNKWFSKKKDEYTAVGQGIYGRLTHFDTEATKEGVNVTLDYELTEQRLLENTAFPFVPPLRGVENRW